MFETLTRTKRARGVLFRPPQRRGPAKLRQRVTRALIKSVRVGSRLHVVWRYFTSENMFLGAGRMPHKKHNPAKCSEHKKWHAFWTENVLETENTYQCKLLGCSETPLEKEAMAKHVAQHCEGMHLCIPCNYFAILQDLPPVMVDTTRANSLKHREMAYLHPKRGFHVSFSIGSYVCALHAIRKQSVKPNDATHTQYGTPFTGAPPTDTNVPLCEVCTYFAQIQGTTGIIPADEYHLVSSEHTRYVQTKVDWIEFALHCEQNKFKCTLCATEQMFTFKGLQKHFYRHPRHAEARAFSTSNHTS